MLSLKTSRYFTFLLLLLFCLTACVTSGTTARVTSGQDSPGIDQAQAEYYNGPKARIAVSRFKNKAGGGWWTTGIGDGMADQLTTALFNTNRFIVLERQALKDVLSEQDLGASGRVRSDTAAAIGEIEGAELLVVAAVTEFQADSSGGGGSLSGSVSDIFGAVLGGFKRSHLAIDLRIIDSRTSRILAATSVEGEATDVNLGGLLGGYGSAGTLVGGLSGWKNTPIEKAMRICIKEAVNFIATKTPRQYYHYGQPRHQPESSYSPGSEAAGGNGETVIVNVNSLNIRSGPGSTFSLLFAVGNGTRLTVMEHQNKWIRIKAPNGREGWTAGWLTRPVQ